MVMQTAQSLAFALLAGLPPEVGWCGSYGLVFLINYQVIQALRTRWRRACPRDLYRTLRCWDKIQCAPA